MAKRGRPKNSTIRHQVALTDEAFKAMERARTNILIRENKRIKKIEFLSELVIKALQ
jgi:hypothetical protein